MGPVQKTPRSPSTVHIDTLPPTKASKTTPQVSKYATNHLRSIEDLPPEILVIIFKFVFMGSRTGTFRVWQLCSCTNPKLRTPCDCHEKPFKTTWIEEDYTNPYIFPYATSLVCSRWRSLVEAVPIFWTRVIIFVDANPTPLPRLQTHLRLSGDLPLDLYVLRRPGTYDGVDRKEQARCGTIINILEHYFQRCRIISFDVIHNSSLPSITLDFHGKAPHLVNLKLKCRLDDGWKYIARPPKRPNTKPFSFPALETLDVDGRNFADACINMSTWGRCLAATKKLHVSISNFNPISNSVDNECSMVDVVKALHRVPYITMLRLVNVEFRETYLEDWNGQPKALELNNIDLVDVSQMLIEDLFEFAQIDLQYLHVTRSPLPDLGATSHTEMILEDIPAHEDIAAFLRQWRGSDLDIIGCVAFDDSAVDALGIKHFANGPHTTHERRNFRIADCPNVSTCALKNLIASRNSNMFGQGDRCTLRVSGKGEILSPDDREWFRENLDDFHWNTVQTS